MVTSTRHIRAFWRRRRGGSGRDGGVESRWLHGYDDKPPSSPIIPVGSSHPAPADRAGRTELAATGVWHTPAAMADMGSPQDSTKPRTGSGARPNAGSSAEPSAEFSSGAKHRADP